MSEEQWTKQWSIPINATSRVKRSEQLGELAKALAMARSKMPPIEKHQQGQKGKQTYKYADLATIYGAVIEPLSEQGIAHMQFPTYNEGRFIVTTILVHGDSGQWIESECEFLYDADAQYATDPKEQGLVITYVRRYAFIAAIGVIPGGEDDESNRRKRNDADQNTLSEPDWKNDQAAKSAIWKQMQANGYGVDAINGWLKELDVSSFAETTTEQRRTLFLWLTGQSETWLPQQSTETEPSDA